MPSKPIFLIGMPASGKTTFGQALAVEAHLPFFDLDQLIVARLGRSIPEIFKQEGEESFRTYEKEMLHEFLKSRNDRYVLALGGGTPCYFDNIEELLRHGWVVFLNPSFEVLVKNAKASSGEGSRPLLGVNENIESRLKDLWDKRITFYQRAHYTIDPLIESPTGFLSRIKTAGGF